MVGATSSTMTEKTRDALYEYVESLNRVITKLEPQLGPEIKDVMDGATEDLLEALNQETVT